MHVVGFDIETATGVSGDWQAYRPLGITCAALWSREDRCEVWYSVDEAGNPLPQMTSSKLTELVNRMLRLVDKGYTIVTWNGLGFDFDVLAEESKAKFSCAGLARNHVDMMFHVYVSKGYPISLQAATQGMGIEGKTEGVSGENAPDMWLNGDYQKVLEYVMQDAKITAELAKTCERQQKLKWISKTGREQVLPLRRGWFTVDEALEQPEPDTSWMSEPIPRERFTEWLDQAEDEWAELNKDAIDLPW